jgi:hypothetical protein
MLRDLHIRYRIQLTGPAPRQGCAIKYNRTTTRSDGSPEGSMNGNACRASNRAMQIRAVTLRRSHQRLLQQNRRISGLPRCLFLRRYWGTSGHQTRPIRTSRFMSPRPSATLADFSRARDSQITFSVTHGWSAFWRGRPWLAERRIRFGRRARFQACSSAGWH